MVNNDDGKNLVRADTSTNWSNANPVLAKGEIGYNSSTGGIKIGNGTSAWNSLGYIGYLPLSGGTITGEKLSITPALLGTDTYKTSIFNAIGTDGAIKIQNGTSWTDGGSIELYGRDTTRTEYASSFNLFAHDGTTSKNLQGKPDGTLTWGGNSIALAKDYFPVRGGYINNDNVTLTSGQARSFVGVKIKDGAGTSREHNVLWTIGSANAQYGAGYLLQSGGAGIISSGESGTAFTNAITLNGETEQLYFTSDNAIYFETDCNTIANRKQYTMQSTVFQADTTNTATLGASGHVWKQLFAGTTTISTSDERYKQDIEEIPNEVLDAWGEVQFVQFRFKDAYEEKGENARLHTGVIAQRIKEIFERHNLDAFRYGLLCYDEWGEENNNGIITQAGNKYSVRYEECLCMEASYQRRRADRLEERVAKLETLLENSINENPQTENIVMPL